MVHMDLIFSKLTTDEVMHLTYVSLLFRYAMLGSAYLSTFAHFSVRVSSFSKWLVRTIFCILHMNPLSDIYLWWMSSPLCGCIFPLNDNF